MLKIKKGDEVIVLTGRDKGKQGTVTKRLPNNKLVVEGINRVKKHQRPVPARGVSGGIVEQEAPIDVSNVALYNPETKKADRVGFRVLEDGRKVRFFKSTKEVVDV